jgi:hypothetical protein
MAAWCAIHCSRSSVALIRLDGFGFVVVKQEPSKANTDAVIGKRLPVQLELLSRPQLVPFHCHGVPLLLGQGADNWTLPAPLSSFLSLPHPADLAGINTETT